MVMEILGHSTLAIVKRYQHAWDARQP